MRQVLAIASHLRKEYKHERAICGHIFDQGICMQTWATFSIIDHRFPIYRQALALFDGIIVPIPPAPIGNQTPAELEQLRIEIDYLAEYGAAKVFPWSSGDFDEWRAPFLAEAVATGINRDPYLDTRLMGAEKFTGPDIQAVPVYGGDQHYQAARRDLMNVEEALTVELMQRLPVPDHDTPLDSLLRLRDTPAFKSALQDLLEWKRTKILVILSEENRAEAIAASLREFDAFTKKYAHAMEAEGYGKIGRVASIFFCALTGEWLGALKESAVSFREVREPCWKKVSDLKCSPAGVVYHFGEAMR